MSSGESSSGQDAETEAKKESLNKAKKDKTEKKGKNKEKKKQKKDADHKPLPGSDDDDEDDELDDDDLSGIHDLLNNQGPAMKKPSTKTRGSAASKKPSTRSTKNTKEIVWYLLGKPVRDSVRNHGAYTL